MSSERAVLGLNGSSASLQSVNKIAAAAARADDFALSELLKLKTFGGGTSDKAILPYEERGQSFPLVIPGAAAAPVIVMPFKAVLGTRSLANATPIAPPPAANGDPLLTLAPEQAYRDIRSASFVTNQGLTAGFGYKIPAAAFVSNAGVHPRWDLVYATFYLDKATTGATVIVKPSVPGSSGTAGPVSASPTVVSSVGSPPMATTGPAPAISVVTGIAAVPVLPPPVPADNPAAGIYNFPLALIQIPANFTSDDPSLGVITTEQICMVASNGLLAETVGGTISRPCSTFTGFAAATYQPSSLWGGGSRPGEVLQSTMVGGIDTWLLINATAAAGAAVLGDTAILDNSLDWRNRFFDVRCTSSPSVTFASSPGAGASYVPDGTQVGPTNTAPACAMGQSFQDDSVHAFGGSTRNAGVVIALNNSNYASMGVGDKLGLYVDLATGNLRLQYAGTPGVRVAFHIQASGYFANF